MRAYPKSFRERFEADLMEVFLRQQDEVRYAGWLGSLGFWREILWDWALTVFRARDRGMPGDVATGAASHRMRGGGVVDTLRQDLGFALRSLLRAPGFAAVAVLTLAMGIGSTAAIFGVVNSVLVKPLPYGGPDRVVTIWSSWVGFRDKTWVSESEYRAYLNRARTLEDLAIWSETDVTFTDPENPERVAAVSASENLVDVLGVDMEHGRFFSREEAQRADTMSSDVIVLSHDAWARRFGSDPGVVGALTEVNGRTREVIGVLPEGFRMPTQFATLEVADVYFPYFIERTAPTDYPEGGGSHGWYLVGRARTGVTVEQVRADIESVVESVHADFGAYPAERQFRPLVFGAKEDVLGTMRPALMALLVTVGLVLLIAIANVANLLLARSDDRADELAVRAALGAGRGRLVFQMLVESLVLALMGGTLGIALAIGSVDLFKALNPGSLPRIGDVSVDGTVLGFALLVTLGTSVLFGVLPALRVTGGALKARMGRRSERGVGRSGWQGTLVALEVAMAVVLVIGAGLMGRTFQELTSIEPGFDGAQTLTLALSLPTTRYPDPDASALFYQEVLRQVGELPGVRSTGAIRSLPLASRIGDWGLDVEGYDESVNPRAAGDWQIVTPGYFETIGIPMLEGRSVEWSDDGESRPVAIVNQAFVRTYWPNEEPLGRTFVMSGTTVTVVGVVGDVRHNGLTEDIKAKFYIPVGQWGIVTRGNPTSLRLVLGTEGDPDELVAPVREVVRGLDPSLAVAEVRTVDDVLANAVAQPRFMVVLMGLFSVIALALALVGVYGVIAYGVGKRTQEIGVRMALGAVENQVVGMVVRDGASMIVVGLGAGIALSFLLSRYLEALMYGVTATDPLTFVGVALGFTAVAWLATWIPSRRAARIDPIKALKAD